MTLVEPEKLQYDFFVNKHYELNPDQLAYANDLVPTMKGKGSILIDFDIHTGGLWNMDFCERVIMALAYLREELRPEKSTVHYMLHDIHSENKRAMKEALKTLTILSSFKIIETRAYYNLRILIRELNELEIEIESLKRAREQEKYIQANNQIIARENELKEKAMRMAKEYQGLDVSLKKLEEIAWLNIFIVTNMNTAIQNEVQTQEAEIRIILTQARERWESAGLEINLTDEAVHRAASQNLVGNMSTNRAARLVAHFTDEAFELIQEGYDDEQEQLDVMMYANELIIHDDEQINADAIKIFLAEEEIVRKLLDLKNVSRMRLERKIEEIVNEHREELKTIFGDLSDENLSDLIREKINAEDFLLTLSKHGEKEWVNARNAVDNYDDELSVVQADVNTLMSDVREANHTLGMKTRRELYTPKTERGHALKIKKNIGAIVHYLYYYDQDVAEAFELNPISESGEIAELHKLLTELTSVASPKDLSDEQRNNMIERLTEIANSVEPTPEELALMKEAPMDIFTQDEPTLTTSLTQDATKTTQAAPEQAVVTTDDENDFILDLENDEDYTQKATNSIDEGAKAEASNDAAIPDNDDDFTLDFDGGEDFTQAETNPKAGSHKPSESTEHSSAQTEANQPPATPENDDDFELDFEDGEDFDQEATNANDAGKKKPTDEDDPDSGPKRPGM